MGGLKYCIGWTTLLVASRDGEMLTNIVPTHRSGRDDVYERIAHGFDKSARICKDFARDCRETI